MENWDYKEIQIGEVKQLLEAGYDIEVDSPDGFVPVSVFVDKGEWDEYLLTSESGNVQCNENHLFETNNGWKYAKEMLDSTWSVLTNKGYVSALVHKTDKKIPIVDIQVDHKNHRYYTNGISSHNTGVGKSLFMCHMAASCLAQGKNVLYVTLEMAEERIAERLDANLLNIDIDQIKELPKDTFNKRITKLAIKTTGKLIIKEYPTAAAHAGHFKSLLSELYLKKQFKPDVVFIDYLNICASSRFKPGGAINSYMYVKAIAEELRGLAVEHNVPVVSATQTTRSGFANTDVDLTDTSESFGLPATADFMFALISTEEMEQLNQLMVKQLKNRYNDPTFHKRFVIGVDRAKMRLYDLEESAQVNVIDSGIKLEEQELDDYSFDKMFKKKDFSGIKI